MKEFDHYELAKQVNAAIRQELADYGMTKFLCDVTPGAVRTLLTILQVTHELVPKKKPIQAANENRPSQSLRSYAQAGGVGIEVAEADKEPERARTPANAPNGQIEATPSKPERKTTSFRSGLSVDELREAAYTEIRRIATRRKKDSVSIAEFELYKDDARLPTCAAISTRLHQKWTEIVVAALDPGSAASDESETSENEPAPTTEGEQALSLPKGGEPVPTGTLFRNGRHPDASPNAYYTAPNA